MKTSLRTNTELDLDYNTSIIIIKAKDCFKDQEKEFDIAAYEDETDLCQNEIVKHVCQ